MVKISEQMFYVLAALTDGPAHGYGIAKTARELSNDKIKLTAGTLYGVLDRLLEREQIIEDRREVVSGRERRYYKLTDSGAAALEAAAKDRQASAKVALDRLASSKPGFVSVTQQGRAACWKVAS